MYGCETWTVKKAENQRIDVFKLWCWRKLPRVPWTARRSNWSILKEINPEYSLEGLILKLKLQYFGHLLWTAKSLEKFLIMGKIEGRRGRRPQKMRWLFESGNRNTGVSASAPVLLMNIHGWFPLRLTDLISLQSKGLSRVFSRTIMWNHQFFSAQPSLWSNFQIRTWLLENHSFDYRDLCQHCVHFMWTLSIPLLSL